jgi:hypothetical protein
MSDVAFPVWEASSRGQGSRLGEAMDAIVEYIIQMN